MLQVKEFRQERNISQPQAVAVIREQYPGMDKHLLSKVENPERYGVRLVNGAEQLLEEAFPRTAPEARKPDRRRLPKRVQCRMSKRQYERLQQALSKAGYDTMQEGLTAIIGEWLNNV